MSYTKLYTIVFATVRALVETVGLLDQNYWLVRDHHGAVDNQGNAGRTGADGCGGLLDGVGTPARSGPLSV